MLSFFLAIMFPIIVTLASSLNDSSEFWDFRTRVGSASNCRSSIHGPFDEFGIESSIPSGMRQDTPGSWHYDLMAELPSEFKLIICDQDVNNNQASMRTFPDVDNDTYKDFLLPSLSPSNIVHVTKFPPSPNLAYRISIGGANRQYFLTPVGSRQIQVVIYLLLGTIPVLTGFASIWIYWYAFCTIKVHKFNRTQNLCPLPINTQSEIRFEHWFLDTPPGVAKHEVSTRSGSLRKCLTQQSGVMTGWHRQTILIATLGYEINNRDIKISVGELGFVAHLMSKYLADQDLVWVVPCVQGIEYPCDQRAEPMNVTILGVDYIVQVQYHFVQNITYVLLDAPIFRAQTIAEPYPLHTGDIRSAIYYSAWYVFFIIEKKIPASVLCLLPLLRSHLCCISFCELRSKSFCEDVAKPSAPQLA